MFKNAYNTNLINNWFGLELWERLGKETKKVVLKSLDKEWKEYIKKRYGSEHKYKLFLIKRMGFKSYKEYSTFQANQKGFKSEYEYRKALAQEKGFNTPYLYFKYLKSQNKRSVV